MECRCWTERPARNEVACVDDCAPLRGVRLWSASGCSRAGSNICRRVCTGLQRVEMVACLLLSLPWNERSWREPRSQLDRPEQKDEPQGVFAVSGYGRP